ncbi:MAG: hypothetical protein HRF44_10805 [Ignavibacterium sp.]|jgi:hypothetical protein
MREVTKLLLPPFLILPFSLFVFSCADDEPLGPARPPVRHAIQLIDSSYVLAATYIPPSTDPVLTLNAGISLRILSDSARVAAYSVGIGNVTKHYVPVQGTLSYNSLFTIALQETFTGIVPFISRPAVELVVELKTYVGLIESTLVFTHVSQRIVDWTGVQEPGLEEIDAGAGQTVSTGELIWARDNSGFFFSAVQSGKSIVSFYKLADSSVTSTTPVDDSFRAYDVSQSGGNLLIGPSTGTPGGLLLLEIGTGLTTPLLAALPDRIITSARFSSNDSGIVLTTHHTDSSALNEVWLYRRGGGSIARMSALSDGTSLRIVRWLPSSNDKFVFHRFGSALSVYSLSDSTISTFPFTAPFYPSSLLDDGFTVLGTRTIADGSLVVESHVWKYTLTDQAVRQLTYVDEVLFEAKLSPDGTKLAFLAQRGGKLGLYVLKVTGVLGKRGQ